MYTNVEYPAGMTIFSPVALGICCSNPRAADSRLCNSHVVLVLNQSMSFSPFLIL